MKPTFRFFSLLLLFFVFSTITKGQIDWWKHYGRPNITERVIAIYPGEQANEYWIAGQTGSSAQDDLFLSLVDSTGTEIWADTFGSINHNEEIWAFHRDPFSGKMWVSALQSSFDDRTFHAVLYGFEKNGNLVSTIEVPDKEPTFSLNALSDGSVLALLLTNFSEIHLVKYDKDGVLVFNDTIQDSNRTHARNTIEELEDGRFFIFYNIGSTVRGTAQAFLSFRNPDNSVIWEKEVVSELYTGQTLSRNVAFYEADSTVIISHSVNNSRKSLSKFDLTGEKLWEIQLVRNPRGTSRDQQIFFSNDSTFAHQLYGRTEIRHASDGRLLQNVYFDDYRIEGGCFTPFGNLATVGNLERDGKYALTTLTDQTTLFEKTIGISGPPDEDTEPLMVSDGDFIYMASVVDNGPTQRADFELRKIETATGIELWKNTFGDTSANELQGIIFLEDGSLLASAMVDVENASQADTISFYKINPIDGSLIWRKELNNYRSAFNINLCALQDSGFVITYRGYLIKPDDPQSFYSNQLLAAKYDKNGNQVWHQWYPDDWANNGEEPSGRSLHELVCLEDQTIIGLGEEEGYAGLILHINSTDGILINPIQVDDSLGDQIRSFWNGIETNEGDWIAVCYNFSSNEIPYLYKISKTGEILIKKEFKFSSYHYGSRIIKGNDGSIFLVLSYNGSGISGPNGIKVLRLDDNLNTIATLDITNDLLRAFAAIPLQDNTLAISIETTPTNSEDIILLKTETIPLVNTNTVVKNSTEITLFPNPIQKGSAVTISFEEPFNGKATFKLIAADGKEVFSQLLHANSTKEFDINISPVSSGIYTALLQKEDISWTGKLVVR